MHVQYFYRGISIDLETTENNGVRWVAHGHGKVIGSGSGATKQAACLAAEGIADNYLDQPTHFKVNVWGDGTVLTSEGEILGVLLENESGAIYEFVPIGNSKTLFAGPFRGLICELIEEWYNNGQTT